MKFKHTNQEVLDAWQGSDVCKVVSAADLCDRFVVMDDNQTPFAVKERDHLSRYSTMSNAVLLVALHRRIMLDAIDAEDTVNHVLGDSDMGIFNWAGEYMRDCSIGTKENPVVVRLFLASGRRFKEKRVASADRFRAMYYRQIPLPHFVWVAELYGLKDYRNAFGPADGVRRGAFGELVIDATFSKNDDPSQSVLIWDFPDRFAVRGPSDEVRSMTEIPFYTSEDESRTLRDEFQRPAADGWMGLKPFDGNLESIDL